MENSLDKLNDLVSNASKALDIKDRRFRNKLFK